MSKKIGDWLIKLEKQLSSQDFSEADNLLAHDEWEMAFEILLLGLIASEIEVSDDEKNELAQIAVECGFDTEGGVSDYYIWEKFLKWSGHVTVT